jgi:hypothetical protein
MTGGTLVGVNSEKKIEGLLFNYYYDIECLGVEK